MKILVIGAGVIGTTYGFQLSAVGNIVVHYIRGEKSDLIKNNGIQINCIDEREKKQKRKLISYNPEVITKLDSNHSFDLIIVSAGCEQLLPILELLQGKVAGATVLILQNIRPKELSLIPDYIGKDSYVIGFPFIAGGEKKNNEINCSIYSKSIFHTMLGEPNGNRTQRLLQIYTLMKQIKMKPRITNRIQDYLKVHYVWAAINAAALIKAGNYRAFVEKPCYLRDSYLAMREIWNIYKREGIRANRMSPTKYYYFPLFLVVPISQKIYDNKLTERVMIGHVSRCRKEIHTMYYDIWEELNSKEALSLIFFDYQKCIDKYYLDK